MFKEKFTKKIKVLEVIVKFRYLNHFLINLLNINIIKHYLKNMLSN